MNVADIEYQVAVLAEWLTLESFTQYTLHHDISAFRNHRSNPIGRLETAQYVLLNKEEWNAVPLEYGTVVVKLQDHFFTAMNGRTPTVHEGFIVAYGDIIRE